MPSFNGHESIKRVCADLHAVPAVLPQLLRLGVAERVAADDSSSPCALYNSTTSSLGSLGMKMMPRMTWGAIKEKGVQLLDSNRVADGQYSFLETARAQEGNTEAPLDDMKLMQPLRMQFQGMDHSATA